MKGSWSNHDLNMIQKYKRRVKQFEKQTSYNKPIQKGANCIQFYDIKPKQQLPLYLQKLKFQTTHCREKQTKKAIKLWRKENDQNNQNLKKKVKHKKNLMQLSQIFEHLQETGQLDQQKVNKNNFAIVQKIDSNLQEWQKLHQIHLNQIYNKTFRSSLLPIENNKFYSSTCQNKGIQKQNKFIRIKNKFEIQKNLETIKINHIKQIHLMNKFQSIQMNSKLLKKSLDEYKKIIKIKIQKITQLISIERIKHHQLFKDQMKLIDQKRKIIQMKQIDIPVNILLKSMYLFTNDDKILDNQILKQQQIVINNNKIKQCKQKIQKFENEIKIYQEILNNLQQAQQIYYNKSLKIGQDYRDTGLDWILKQLKEKQINKLQFPSYIDKKTKIYIINKAKNSLILEQLLENKINFVSKIGRNRNNFYTANVTPDKIQQRKITNTNIINIPKRCRRSKRQITALSQQYVQNQSLIELKSKENGLNLQFSTNINKSKGKQLYQMTRKKIKDVDLNSLKKDKISTSNIDLLEYQNILQYIADIHIILQEQQIQHQQYLLKQYKDQKELFFNLAAASFGYKKAYSQIIKNFPWHNNDQ